MNENQATEVTPIQATPSDVPTTGATDAKEGQQPAQPEAAAVTDPPKEQLPKAVDNITQQQLEEILTVLHSEDSYHTQVNLPNGTAFDLVAKVTLGDALIAAALFLLLSFEVIKWLLNHVWGRN